MQIGYKRDFGERRYYLMDILLTCIQTCIDGNYQINPYEKKYWTIIFLLKYNLDEYV